MWTTDQSYNAENGIKSFYETEAKFPAFSNLPFEDICIGMKTTKSIRWLRISSIKKDSLLSLFKSGVESNTTIGRSAWKGLIENSSLQMNCNKEGFNLKDGDSSLILARIGYTANNEDDCNSCDSFIGIGLPNYRHVSCGNIAPSPYFPDNGGRNSTAMCYVLIK